MSNSLKTKPEIVLTHKICVSQGEKPRFMCFGTENMLSFDEILSRVKQILKTESDKDVAIAIGMKPNAFYNRKKTKSVPLAEFVCLANTENVSSEWLLFGRGPINNDSMVADPKTKYTPSDKNDVIVVEHSDLVKEFKDQETAKEFNHYLIGIEKEDPEGYEDLFNQAKTIYRTIHRLKKKTNPVKSDEDHIKKTS